MDKIIKFAYNQLNDNTMKKILILMGVLLLSQGLMWGQNVGVSRAKKIIIVKQEKVLPPVLDIVEGSFKFVDPSGNNALDAGEECKIRMVVRNSGMGDAVGCIINVKMDGDVEGVQIGGTKTLPVIKVNQEMVVEVPIKAAAGILSGNLNFTVSVDEPNGFGTVPSTLAVSTLKFKNPLLKVVDYSITGASATGKLAKRTPFDLQLLVQNVEYGNAENVKVEIELPANVYLLSGNNVSNYEKLQAGETKSIEYNLIVNNVYQGSTIPIKVKISEKHGQYAENKTMELSLNQNLAANKLVVNATNTQALESIAIASLSADVDKNIPMREEKQSNTFAVIIANENYHSESQVPFAVNDGQIFSKYCENTLGIPSKNIHFCQNATLNVLRGEIDWITKVMKAYNGEAKVVFYYAGHGIPDESEKSAYLLPVDGNGMNYMTGYSLNELYASLSSVPSKSVTVFMDACFSGTKREGDMLAKNGRGIAVRVKGPSVSGNMVVFSASQGDETAYPYSDKSHGMFTYFLLKKLQETGGNISYKELGDYITSEVSKNSIVINGKSQTPMVTPSMSISSEWEKWLLVK